MIISRLEKVTWLNFGKKSEMGKVQYMLLIRPQEIQGKLHVQIFSSKTNKSSLGANKWQTQHCLTSSPPFKNGFLWNFMGSQEFIAVFQVFGEIYYKCFRFFSQNLKQSYVWSKILLKVLFMQISNMKSNRTYYIFECDDNLEKMGGAFASVLISACEDYFYKFSLQ